MNYTKDIQIDPHALDLEWLEQPSLMLKYAEHAAKMRMVRDKLKENVDLVRAEMDKAVRTNPENYGIEKVTETVVSNTILTTKEYQDAQEEFNLAKYEADVAGATTNAFDARKTALENMVKLYGQQYFAGPKIPRDLYKEVEARKAQAEKVDQGIASKLMQRKRRIMEE